MRCRGDRWDLFIGTLSKRCPQPAADQLINHHFTGQCTQVCVRIKSHCLIAVQLNDDRLKHTALTAVDLNDRSRPGRGEDHTVVFLVGEQRLAERDAVAFLH